MTKDQLITAIREEFCTLLEAKTGWGKIELKTVFEQAVGQALARFVEEFKP